MSLNEGERTRSQHGVIEQMVDEGGDTHAAALSWADVASGHAEALYRSMRMRKRENGARRANSEDDYGAIPKELCS